VFGLQDQVTSSVVSLIAPEVEKAEIERAIRKSTGRLDSHDSFMRGMALVYKGQLQPARDFFVRRWSGIPTMARLTPWPP
jgi:hypothetical protein